MLETNLHKDFTVMAIKLTVSFYLCSASQFHVFLPCLTFKRPFSIVSKTLVDTFNQEKVLVGVFSMIAKLCEGSFPALVDIQVDVGMI